MSSGLPPSLIVWDCKSSAFLITTKTFFTFFSKKLCLFYNLLIINVLQDENSSFYTHFQHIFALKNRFQTIIERHFFFSIFAKIAECAISPIFSLFQDIINNSILKEKIMPIPIIYIGSEKSSRLHLGIPP